MSRQGYLATSVTDICRESGLPVGSIYWHFKSKIGLLAAVMERGTVRFFEQLPRIEEFEGSGRDRFRKWFEANTTLPMRGGDFLRLYMTLALKDDLAPEVQAIIARVRGRGMARLTQAMLPMLEEVGLPDATSVAEELAYYMLVCVDGIMISRQIDGEKDIRPLMNTLHTALLLLVDERVSRAQDSAAGIRH